MKEILEKLSQNLDQILEQLVKKTSKLEENKIDNFFQQFEKLNIGEKPKSSVEHKINPFEQKKNRSKTMEIVEVIKSKENVKEFIEEKLKKTIKEVTPYKKSLVQNPKITRFFSQHTISSLGNIVYLDLVSSEIKQKLLKNKTDKYMHLGVILIGIIGLHRKEI